MAYGIPPLGGRMATPARPVQLAPTLGTPPRRGACSSNQGDHRNLLSVVSVLSVLPVEAQPLQDSRSRLRTRCSFRPWPRK